MEEAAQVGRQPLEAPELLPPREVVLPPELVLPPLPLDVLPLELPVDEPTLEAVVLPTPLELAVEALVLTPTLEVAAEPLVLPPVVLVPALFAEKEPEFLLVVVDPRLLPDDEPEEALVVPAGQISPMGWQYPSGQHIVPAIAVQSPASPRWAHL